MKKSFIVSLALFAGFGLQGNARASTQLTYNDFSSTSGYTSYGGAVQSGNALQLTTQGAQNSAGGVFFTTPVDVTSFSTSFSFTFSNTPQLGADGLVFVIKNADSPTLGAIGGGIGYGGNDKGSGITQSVGVEFDSWQNDAGRYYNDSNGNHIGIDENGSMISVAQSNVTTSFNGTGIWYAWVDYDGSTMTVSTNQTGFRPASPMLSYNIDLQETIGSSTGLVGFTAATGTNTQTTTLLSLNHYSPNPEPSTYLLMGIGALIAGLAGRRRLGGMSTEY